MAQREAGRELYRLCPAVGRGPEVDARSPGHAPLAGELEETSRYALPLFLPQRTGDTVTRQYWTAVTSGYFFGRPPVRRQIPTSASSSASDVIPTQIEWT